MQSYNNLIFDILKERFKFGGENDAETHKSIWWIPLTYTSDFKTLEHVWLGASEQTLESLKGNSSANQWLVANVNETGD